MPIVDHSMNGQVALITGGSKGIGRAIALAFAENGADVAITARGLEALDATASELRELGNRVLAIPADVGNTEAVEALYERVVAELGGIDVLVNNAARGGGRAISKLKEDVFQRVMAVNLWGPIRLSQLCRTTMQDRGGGMIINIASNEGLRASPGLGIYPPSKAALINFTELIGKEWAKDGIRAVAVAPGLCRTELAAGLVEMVEKNDIAINPMRRIGEPEDIAALVLTLATQAGRFATSTTYVLDGGELSAGPLG
ncbi:MAG: SDR family NAD(P)-dependent oxidoreductase [Acidobacteriota bacterium]|nr:SDR family NAD(P)-dependent oxidoreductase [Acidobacteriota bacterium]